MDITCNGRNLYTAPLDNLQIVSKYVGDLTIVGIVRFPKIKEMSVSHVSYTS